MKLKHRSLNKSTMQLIALILFLAIGGIRQLVWNDYLAKFDVFINNDMLEQITPASEYVFTENYRFRTYRDVMGTGYKYYVEMPQYPRVNMGRFIVVSENASRKIEITIWMNTRRNLLGIGTPLYVVGIDENIARNHSISSMVDRSGEALEKPSDDSWEQYQTWLKLYRKYESEIKDIFTVIHCLTMDELQ